MSENPSIESQVKDQFAKIYTCEDWKLFKRGADFYFENAAKVLKKDISYCDDSYKLLFRNINKRLYLGIACELLVKAIYLKNGFSINKFLENNKEFPQKFSGVSDEELNEKDCFTFNQCIQKLNKVVAWDVSSREIVEKGLKIAKIFRNKEVHGIVFNHSYKPESYRIIEESVILSYELEFSENLDFRVSFELNEKGKFSLRKIKKLSYA